MDKFDFCFKGKRNYIQGGDIYNAIVKHLRERYGDSVTRIDLSFHRLSSHNMMAEVLDTGRPAFPVPPNTICRFAVLGEEKTLYLLERDEPVGCRREYDEASIVSQSSVSVDARSIIARNATPYSSIEIAIALNKRLMQTLFANHSGKWLFTRLSLVQPLPDSSAATFVLTLRQNLGCRLTCSTIAIDGVPYGDIYFSLVKAASA